MPERTEGEKSSRLWQVFLWGVLLVLCAVLMPFISSTSTPTPTVTAFPLTQANPTGTAFPPATGVATQPPFGPVVINIVNPDPEIETIVVRGVESGQMDNIDDDLLVLPVCRPGNHFSVWAPGYYIGTFPCGSGATTSYDVELRAVDTTDNPNYTWVGAESGLQQQNNCENCHGNGAGDQTEYTEWIRDGHSQSLIDPYFRTTYMGTDIYGRPSQQIQWTILNDGQRIYPLIDPFKPDYGAGYRPDYPVSNGNCALCHVPAGSPGTLREMDLAGFFNPSGVSHASAVAEGVTCDVCHKVTDVLVDKNTRLPYDDRPGILSMSVLRPITAQHFVTGPLPFQSNLGNSSNSTCYPIFSESEFCAACHYGKFANTLIYGSYKEWLDSPYSNRNNGNYRSCQDCHMLHGQDIQSTVSTTRAACSDANVNFRNFNHNMMDYGEDDQNSTRNIPRMVKNAAEITLTPTLSGGQIHVKVTVVNTAAGHKLPTDSPLRHLILVVEARDWRNNLLTQSDGPRIPVWAAPDYGGYAGQIFANILKDKDTNLAPSFAYWNPVEAAWQGADTRLPPLTPVQSIYSFAAPYDRSATITARLIYRKAFLHVAQEKGWSLSELDVEVTNTAVECTGFGPAPETIVCELISSN